MSMPSSKERDSIEVVTSVQRRRRWSVDEKVRLVEETEQPGMSVSSVARKYELAPSLLFRWKRLLAEGGRSALGADEAVVPASEAKALQARVRELERLLGKKTLETEILREAVRLAREKKLISRASSWPKDDSP
jgi:transposase